ncbi:xanthine dehydrogenase family protein molybdopterin-binding subunit [[Erwinia] mediterraneensis]|uniref:xanthine dehydrogenase family protein molybdopterin-binding subunit n=1 Tax=[Erwinia] mediterraneensis TaxID=2161819 RepID=UPI001030D6EB|nr:xanthine dehydrogenase family protein molybdopterin-binding subunit [[Erwinia] mediterraneensis]
MAETENSYQALGAKRDRGDGRAKITGQATYAVEHQVANAVHGVVIQSTIASGRIVRMDTTRARQAPGVLAVYTHLNSLKINKPTGISEGGAAQTTYTPIQDDKIIHNGQNIGLVVAETFEQATHAASLVEIEYETTPALIFPDDPAAGRREKASNTINLGNAQQAMAQAEVKIQSHYTTPREYNMPIEPHACIASWENNQITVWEPSQWVMGAQREIAEWMGIDPGQVRVISPYVGGGFGSKPVPYTHVALACVASRALNLPVKVSLTRAQTFTGFGGRPATMQSLQMGASRDGKILAIIQEGLSDTSLIDDFSETTNKVTGRLYAVPNIYARHFTAAINTVTPGWMRAPGENPSAFALEVAMDEMAYALDIDPLEFRLRNWADHDYHQNKPWSTRRLKEAYAAAAEAFGWEKRSMAPRSMREGRELIGWGMATATYPVSNQPAEAKLIFHPDGSLVVQSAGVDIGTGTYTILAQTAAGVLQLPSERIRVELGDSSLARAGVAGGSQLAGNLTAAVNKTAEAMRDTLIAIAVQHPESPLYQVDKQQLLVQDGKVRLAQQPERGIAIARLVRLNGAPTLEVVSGTFDKESSQSDRDEAVHSMGSMTEPEGVSAHSWGAQFVEVRVDEDFGTVRVKRMISAFDSGLLYNPKLARSQWIGAMVMGLGQALLEGGVIDPRNARVINNSLADYLIPVNADVPEIIAIDVGEPDYHATLMGGKAVGELGIVGMAAAISNAVFHATGKRIRDLPISPDKLLE